MGDIRINIAGLSEIVSRLERLPIEVQEEVEGEIIDSVMRINGQQRKLAPIDQGGLRRGIGYERKQGQGFSHFELYSNSEQSGYMEFGTRFRVRVPANLVGIAESMRGPGIATRLRAKEAIYAWCKRKGIEKRAWYPIYLAIMTIGVKPKPFFFQPFFDEAPRLLERVERLVNDYNETI
jgi:GNAT superfamily N-acetyltransferase